MLQLPKQSKASAAAPQNRDTPSGLTLGVPGACPAGITAQAGPGLGVTGLPVLAAGTQLETALPMESRSTGILAEGPVPAGLAGQAEAIHGRAGLAALAAPTAVWAERH